MNVEKIGEGEPDHVIIGSIHGDEPCGKKAIEKFLEQDFEVRKPVKLIIANEEALEEGERFLDADLNRVFPGDPGSDRHEERLAARIVEEVGDARVLDLHSTRSCREPFAGIKTLEEEVLDLARSAGVSRVIHFPEGNGSTSSVFQGIVVETGFQGTREAEEKAYQVLLNFLAAEGVIDHDFERSEPEIYRHLETVEGGGWEFRGKNFEKVEEGEVYAVKDGEELVAEEGFYPVFMSTDGYEEILGHKAEKLEREK